MFTTPKLKTCLFLILLFALTASMSIAGSPEWAWDQGSYEQDGTVTMDGEDYSINPTGHQSLTGKSVKQPPTVIVQTTSGVENSVIFFTRPTQGDFGGDAYCEATFGPGYVMATVGDIAKFFPGVLFSSGNYVYFWIEPFLPPYYNCQNWTANSSGYRGANTFTNVFGTTSGLMRFDLGPGVYCDSVLPVPCVKR